MASNQRHSGVHGQIHERFKGRRIPEKKTPTSVFVLSLVYAQLPDGLKFVYAKIALLSERKSDVIILFPNHELEARSLRPLRSELPALWSDISSAMRGMKDHSFHTLALDKVLGLELPNFSRQLKMKPGIDDDHQMIGEMSNDIRLRRLVFDEKEKPKRQNAKETKAHLKAMVLRTKPEANKWLV